VWASVMSGTLSNMWQASSRRFYDSTTIVKETSQFLHGIIRTEVARQSWTTLPSTALLAVKAKGPTEK
jgi:hypothetical protein